MEVGKGHEAVVKLLLAKDGVGPDSKDRGVVGEKNRRYAYNRATACPQSLRLCLTPIDLKCQAVLAYNSHNNQDPEDVCEDCCMKYVKT
jgi:hypothetical protein